MFEFSELYKQTGNVCTFSPNGLYLATVVDFRIVVRDAETLQITNLFSTTDKIDLLSWSPDSELLLCASFKSSTIQIWSMHSFTKTGAFNELGESINEFTHMKRPNRFLYGRKDVADAKKEEKWTCIIDEGLAGLTFAEWAPDGRHVLAYSDFSLRITVWSLLNKESYTIEYPKSRKTVCWRRDGRYLAVAARRECKDTISVYDAQSWTLAKAFVCDSADLQSVKWSPDGRFLAISDTPLENGLLVYYPSGRLVSKYTLPVSKATALSVKNFAWSPGSQLLAVGGYDETIRLLNYYTWQPLAEWGHKSKLSDPTVTYFMLTNATSSLLAPSERYQVMSASEITLPLVKANLAAPNPKIGVGMLQFDVSGRLLVSRSDSMPNCLWIWDVFTLTQVSLVQNSHPITVAAWNPAKLGMLAFISQPTLYGNVKGLASPTKAGANENELSPERLISWLYIWRCKVQTANLVNPTEELEDDCRQPMSRGKSPLHARPKLEPTEVVCTCEAMAVPATHFLVHDLKWSPKGDSILLYDRDKFCISYCA